MASKIADVLPSVLDCIDLNGYVTYSLLEANEIDSIKDLILHQLLANIGQHSLVLMRELEASKQPFEDYTNIIPGEMHSLIMPKSNRMFTPELSKLFESMCGPFDPQNNSCVKGISDEESIGRPNYYWRLVRPHSTLDVGPPHRDEWFWALNPQHLMPSTELRRIKVWVPLIVDKGKNGLLVSKKSHLSDNIDWHGEDRHGIKKPVLDTDPSELDFYLLETCPGEAVIFHDKLVHTGSINNSDQHRLSFEFTCFV